MSRTVSVATTAKLDATAYAPGFLVQLDLSSTLRFSTRGQVTHNGNIYIPAVLDVRELQDDSSGGSLVFNDPTLAIQMLVRTESLIGKRVQVARYYEGATASTDPIWFFDGYIASAREEAPPMMQIGISRAAALLSLSPARRVGRATGFNVMTPEGSIIRFRGSEFRLERARA